MTDNYEEINEKEVEEEREEDLFSDVPPDGILPEKLYEEKEPMEVRDYLTMIIGIRTEEFISCDDPKQRNEIAQSIQRLCETLARFEENETNQYRIEKENETKLEMNRNDNETKLEMNRNDNAAKLDCNFKENETKVKLAVMDKTGNRNKMIVDVSKDALISAGKIAGGIMLKEILTKYLILDTNGIKPATFASTKIGERVFTNYISKLMI